MQLDLHERIRENLSDVIARTEIYSNFLLSMVHKRKDIEEFKDVRYELMYLRQYTTMLLNLMEKVETSFEIAETSKMRYENGIEQLKGLLGSKSSAPKEQVYPKFATLATTYLNLLEESNMGNDKIDVFETMLENFENFEFTLTEEQEIEASHFMNEQQEIEAREEDEEIFSSNQVIYIEPKHTPEFLQIPLDILGFCLVTLVKSQGVLISGQHNIGVFRFNEESYVFRSAKEAKEFVERPEYFITEFYKLCRRFPILILLLRVEDYFKELGLVLIHVDQGERGNSTKVMLDFKGEMFHFDPHMDPNHNLNEWVLRRKAIQMANIRNMTTKGTQTPDSLYKVENETQVWLKKEACTQTGINKGTNPIRPRNYITDLRDKTLQ